MTVYHHPVSVSNQLELDRFRRKHELATEDSIRSFARETCDQFPSIIAVCSYYASCGMLHDTQYYLDNVNVIIDTNKAQRIIA